LENINEVSGKICIKEDLMMKSNKKFIVGITLSITSLMFFVYLLPQNETRDNGDTKAIKIPQPEFIILDSVDEPLPPNAENVQSMPNKSESQPLPNAELDKPIVITKMPIKIDKQKGREG
jgi:hypothetical protein